MNLRKHSSHKKKNPHLPKPRTTQLPEPQKTIPPNLLTPQPPKPRHVISKSKRLETRGNLHSFCIDTKTFTSVFEGSRADLYSIQEHRGSYKGSMWFGRSSLQWIATNISEWHSSDFGHKSFLQVGKLLL